MDDKVAELERRVSYLERELDMSYEEFRFKQNIEEMFTDDCTIEFRDGRYGYFARVTGIDGDDVQLAIDRLDGTEYGHAVTETGEGLGMEVWSDEQF